MHCFLCVYMYADCINKTFVVPVLLQHVKTTIEPLHHAEVKGMWAATMSRLAPFLGRSCWIMSNDILNYASKAEGCVAPNN